MKKVILLLFISIFTFTTYATETVVKVKAPGYKGINALESDKSDLIYAGTWGDGIYTSSNKGQIFTPKNTGLGNMYINAIAFNTQNHAFVGTQGDGIYITKNSGNLWTKSTYEGNPNVTSLYVNPDNDNEIYAGTYGSGLYVSTDAGSTWEQRNRSIDNNGQFLVLESMHITAISLTKSGTLLVGTYGDGVFRSTDKGLNWRRANSGTGGTKFINQFNIVSSDIILMATNDKGLMESNNDALQWTSYEPPSDSLKDKGITCVEYINDDYALVGTRGNGIWYYNPLPWTEWVPSNLRNYGVVAMTKLTDGTLLAFNFDRGVVRSNNGGVNWTAVSLPQFDIKSYVVNVENDFVINVNNKMYSSSDLGSTWVELTNYEGGMVKDLKYSQGTLIARKEGKVLLSADKGNTWTSTTPGDADDIIDDFIIAPNGDFYCALFFFEDGMPPTTRQELHKSTNQGASWTRIQNFPDDLSSGSKLTSDGNNNIYYYRPKNDELKIYKSTNGGFDFTATGYSLNETVSKLEYKFGNLYVGTYSGLYVSKNNGTSYSKINIAIADRDFGQTQPNQSVETFIIASSNNLYVGLSNHWGVYHTSNGGIEWDSLDAGYPNGRVYSMAVNSSRDLMFAGNLLYKYLNGTQMGVPQLTTPVNEAENQNLDLTLDWEPSSKADLYNFQISTNSTISFSYEDIITSSTEYDIYYKLSPNTTYYWRVRGKTGGVFSSWSNIFSFTTLVGPPDLISPVKDTISVPHLTMFEWSEVEDAKQYRLYIAKDSTLNDVVLQQDNITLTTYTLLEDQKLEPLTIYYWAVAVQGDDGSEGQLSEVWKFRTILAAPVLRLPGNNTVNQPDSLLFSWDLVTEAEDYQIQLSRFSDFSIIVQDNQTLNNTSYSIPQLAANANYYWRVRAIDINDARGPWSDIWTFKTGQERPKHISPANNSGGLPSNVTLDWTDITGFNYWLQVAENPEFTEPLIVNQTSLDKSTFDIKDLAKNKTFYWRVRAVLNDTLSPWTDAWNFSTGLARTVLILPDNNSVQPENTSILFKWELTDGADSYQLQVSNNDSFTNMFLDTTGIPTNSRNVPGLVTGNTYFWRVKAFAGELGNDWSEVRTFNIKKDISTVLSAADSGILVYPNPARDEITLNIPNDIMPNIHTVTIVTQTGQEIMKQSINTSIQQIDVSQFTDGTYYLIIEGRENRYLFKLNKIK